MGRMRLSAVNFLVAAILVVAIKETSSYPTGAPQYTCRSQIPLHVNCTQDGPAPYGIAVNEDGAKVQLVTTDHKKYSVTLASLDDSAFRGFICAVSDAGDDKYLPIGKMSLLPSSANEVQLLSCTKSTADTGVTHTSNSDKHKVQFDWSPPSNVSPGQQYKLRCTMVMEFAKCWTNMQAIIIPLPASTSKNTTGVVDKSDDNTGDRSNAASTTESMSSTRSGNRALKPPNTRVRTPTKKIKFGRTHNSSKTRVGLTTTMKMTDINAGQKSSSSSKTNAGLTTTTTTTTTTDVNTTKKSSHSKSHAVNSAQNRTGQHL